MKPTDKLVNQIEQLQEHTDKELDQRILADIFAVMDETTKIEPAKQSLSIWRFIMQSKVSKMAIAAVIVIVIGMLSIFMNGVEVPKRSVFDILTKACAAEESLFSRQGIIHIVNEITVYSVPNSRDLADDSNDEIKQYVDTANSWLKHNWLPICALKHTGDFRFDQLKLPVQDKSYIVKDESWYNSQTNHFARIMKVGDDLIFANSFDGEYIHTSESVDGALNLVKNEITSQFKSPANPAGFLGIAAGLKGNIATEENASPIQEINEGELDDGTLATIIKTGFKDMYGDLNAYWQFKIRIDDNTIAEMEFIVDAQTVMKIRRVVTETVAQPAISWDMNELRQEQSKPAATPGVGISSNMVIPNVTVDHMVKRATSKPYIFATDPAWANKRQITDCFDPPSPGHRMFIVSYRANDDRHVVFLQSETYNKMLAAVLKEGQLLYTSPTGVKVWGGGDKEKWWTNIVLTSARYVIKDPPSDDRTGYAFQTPAGTFPVVAINGQVTEQELKAMADSLITAEEYLQSDQ